MKATELPFDDAEIPPASPVTPTLITVNDLAMILKISPRSVWRLLSAGKMLEPIRIGGAVRWRHVEVMRWIEDGCPAPHPFVISPPKKG